MRANEMDRLLRTYNVHYWGSHYYDVNDKGNISVTPDPSRPDCKIDLAEITQQMVKQGLKLPTLFCFPQILQHRLQSINQAFKKACQEYQYQGDYRLVYPIKVNQHQRVLEALVSSHEPLGLEAGSKAELLTVLAYGAVKDNIIVCNGYKDRDYIHLALMGEKIGYKVYLVLEKLSEIDLILQEAKKLDVVPRLGVRIKLASQGAGKWQASGGDKSKFGLSATQILQLIDQLTTNELVESLQLVHFHLGSQMTNIRDIAAGVRESARFYVELHKLGVNIQCIDVGGGLGVDYEGSRCQSDFSVNYGLTEYANNIVFEISEACNANKLPHPMIITESGRAITAHHSLLVTDIIGIERHNIHNPLPPAKQAAKVLHNLWNTWQELQKTNEIRSLREYFNDIQQNLYDVHTQYILGMLNLKDRALAEQLYINSCQKIQQQLEISNRAHRGLIDQLEERLADKLYVNFSLFRSIPDAWGIGQLFPILPITGLGKPPKRRAVLLDITCDSDGAVNRFIDGDSVTTTMPLPEYDSQSPPLLGFFMLGAYQEILGNMHNLFGSTAVVNIIIDEHNQIQTHLSSQGSNVADMLEYVTLPPESLLNKFISLVSSSKISNEQQRQFIDFFRQTMSSYTYLAI